jgi:hypothetical protein
MKSMRITGHNNVLKKPDDWDAAKFGECVDLHVKAFRTEEGLAQLQSTWLPSPQELALLQAGCPIILTIIGTQHPPVRVEVGAVADLAVMVQGVGGGRA